MDKFKKSGWMQPLFLLLIVVFIKVFSEYPFLVEKYYSLKTYRAIAFSLRSVTGWIPFSLGDVLYATFVIWIMIRLYKTSRSVIKRSVTRESFRSSFQRTASIVFGVYILFYFLWGLNYSRLGIAYQLRLKPDLYSITDLKKLTGDLIEKVNAARKNLGDSTIVYPCYKEIFEKAKDAYEHAESRYSFLSYSEFSVKRSLYGKLGNYLGFVGYYNPFTGEAQVNVTVPPFAIPYTVCHEMAHQLGYGTEDEANFAGYLAAKSSKEYTFQYSVYYDLFAYANRELFQRDSVAAKENYTLLDTLVKTDILTYRKFLEDHKNPIEPYITLLYGKYLEANNQPYGIETYDEVVSWLIAYKKKFGKL